MIRIGRIYFFTLILFAFSSCIKKQFVIAGKVTNFSGQPLDSVTVRLKNKAFGDVYETISDSQGNYSMKVKKGNYYCFYAIRLADYRINNLEYWAWNIPVYEDLEINPQYDKMEIYGVNVFEPQVTPQETYMIYFRPMSLSKSLRLFEDQNVNKKDMQQAKQAEKLLGAEIVNVAPETIAENELLIEINGIKAKILAISKLPEYGRGKMMYGYNVQVAYSGESLPAFRDETLPDIPDESLPASAGLIHLRGVCNIIQ